MVDNIIYNIIITVSPSSNNDLCFHLEYSNTNQRYPSPSPPTRPTVTIRGRYSYP